MSTFIHVVFKDESRHFSESLYLKLLHVFQVYTVSSVSWHNLKRIQYSVPPNCFFSIKKQVCHRRMCHLSLYFSQQDSVPLSSLESLSFLLSFLGKALVWQGWLCRPVFLSCKKQVRHLPFLCFLTSNCVPKACVPADGGNCVLLYPCA